MKVTLDIGKRAQAASDHMFTRVYKMPSGEDLTHRADIPIPGAAVQLIAGAEQPVHREDLEEMLDDGPHHLEVGVEGPAARGVVEVTLADVHSSREAQLSIDHHHLSVVAQVQVGKPDR